MRAEERRTLLRTVGIAALAAALTAFGVFKLKNWTTPGRSPRDELAGAVVESVRATLAANASTRLTTGPTTIEKQGVADRARAKATSSGKAMGLGPEGFDAALKTATESSVNAVFDTQPATAGLRLLIGDSEQIAVVERWAVLHDAARPILLVQPLGRAMVEADDDDWLLSRGLVSVRLAAQVLVQKHLLAWLRDFERCPTDFRLATHLELGKTLDTTYAAAAETITAADRRTADRLMPLCRRERLRRLADATLRTSKASTRFPFVPMVVLDDSEEAMLKRLEDPAQTPLVGPEARAHISGLGQAESDLKRENAMLRLAVRQALPSVLGELTAVAERLRDAAAPSTMPPWFETLTPAAQRDRARAWACATLSTFTHPSFGPRAITRALDAFTVEHWPAPGEREGLLTALYVAAKQTPPDQGVAALPQLVALAQALLNRGPLGDACDRAPAAELTLPEDQLDTLAARLVP